MQNRRPPIQLLVALTLVGALSHAGAARAPGRSGLGGADRRSQAGRNLLVVTLDTTRADRLGCYGAPDARTPALDRLAAEGLRFDQAVATAPLTLPSHASLFTGLYPPTHGARSNTEFRLAERHVTLAELFASAGYETAAFVSAFVLDARYGLAQGFGEYDDRVGESGGRGFPSGTAERPALATTDAFLSWLDRKSSGKPFFAWVHYFDPHAPYAPREPFASQMPSRPYEAEIASVDAQVGRLREALEKHGLWDGTVVLVVADHGESLGEHGERTHGLFLYDAVMRVPFLLRLPGGSARGVITDRIVSLVDVLPTVVDLFGLADSTRREGESLLWAPSERNRAVYMESLYPWLDYGWAPVTGLRRRADKYVLAPKDEYYDLSTDPGETKSVLASPGRTLLGRSLRKLLAGWPPLLETSPVAVPSAEETARLQSLGYATGPGPGGRGPLRDPKEMVEVASMLIDANALLQSGRNDEALVLAKKAAALSPDDRSVLQLLGKVYLRLGRLAEAEESLRAFTRIRPKADVSLLLAQILILKGQLQPAALLLDQAQALDPRHGGVAIARGDLLAQQGNREEARKAYLRAKQIDPYRAASLAEARLAALQTTGAARPAP